MDTLLNISSAMLFVAFLLYLLATFFFGATIRDKRSKSKKGKAGTIGITITIIGFLAQSVYFVTRWIASGPVPVSNLFEFVTFFGMSIVFGFIILYFIYKISVLGVFALPIALIVIAYASMFPTEVSPLVPSLQSYWLYIHVTTVSLGEAILSISFVVGLIYLIRTIDQSKSNKHTTWLELVLFSLIIFVGFSLINVVFNVAGYNAEFEFTTENGAVTTTDYPLPPIVSPNEGTLITDDVMEPWFDAPSWMRGADAGRKFNTLIWSVLVGLGLYGVLRLVLRKRIGAAIQPALMKTRPELLDEISYRAIAIGFPVFTLGGIIFASIWAQEAWGRFWGWDPKEVWALVTFFFYAAFLHLRLSRGWHGEKSAWLAVGGFAIIMFNLIAVNLVLAGLHSYA